MQTALIPSIHTYNLIWTVNVVIKSILKLYYQKKGVYLSVHHTKPFGVQDSFVSKIRCIMKSNQCKYHVYMLCDTTIIIGVQPHHATSHEYTFFNIENHAKPHDTLHIIPLAILLI